MPAGVRGPVGARKRCGKCLALTLRGEEAECVAHLDDRDFEDDRIHAAVGCTPRVAVMAGVLPKGSRGLRVVLRGGRTLRARIVRVPRRYGGGRAWVLALPRTARVRAVRVEGGRSRSRTPFVLLPAADQCGYGTVAYLPTFSAPVSGD